MSRMLIVTVMVLSIWCWGSLPALSQGNVQYEIIAGLNDFKGFDYQNFASCPESVINDILGGINPDLAGEALAFGGACFGFAQAACDAYYLRLDPSMTRQSVSKSWILTRHKDLLNILSDVLHNKYAFGPNHYTKVNYNYIVNDLWDGQTSPVVLMGNDGNHAVVPYMVLRQSPSNRYYILVYDPNVPWSKDFQPLGRNNAGEITYFSGPYFSVLDNKFEYCSSFEADRFFSVRKYVRRTPDNAKDWAKCVTR